MPNEEVTQPLLPTPIEKETNDILIPTPSSPYSINPTTATNDDDGNNDYINRIDMKMLFQIAIFNIGSHYNSHVLSSLSPEIISKFDTTRLAYGALFSSEELATVILCLASLILVYTPLRPVALILTLSVLLSSSLTTYSIIGCYPPSYNLLIISRFLFGFTQGLLTTVQGSILASQFPTHVGLAFGVMLLTSRLSSFAGLTLPSLLSNNWANFNFSLYFSIFTTIPSVIASFLFLFTRKRHSNNNNQTRTTIPFLSISWSTLSHSFPLSFWYCCILWIVFSGIVYTILHFSVDILTPLFKISSTQASLLSSTIMLIAGLSSPIIGYYQDALKNRPQILLFCCTLMFCGSSSFLLTLLYSTYQTFTVILAFALLSVAFAAGPVTLMACVAVVVPAQAMPAALAFYKAAESGGLAILHVAFGSLRDWSNDYVLSLFMLVVLAAVGMSVAVLLWNRLVSAEMIKKYNGGINTSEK